MQFVVGRASAVRSGSFVLGEEQLYCLIDDLEVAFSEVHWGRRVGAAWRGAGVRNDDGMLWPGGALTACGGALVVGVDSLE